MQIREPDTPRLHRPRIRHNDLEVEDANAKGSNVFDNDVYVSTSIAVISVLLSSLVEINLLKDPWEEQQRPRYSF